MDNGLLYYLIFAYSAIISWKIIGLVTISWWIVLSPILILIVALVLICGTLACGDTKYPYHLRDEDW